MKKWHMFHMGRQGPMISHLMFADDLLFFGEATESQMKCVINTLNTLCSMSGQEVNNKKTSILFSLNVSRITKNRLLQISQFKETHDFRKYLGVPLMGRKLKAFDYQYMAEQISNKLTSWKSNHLSFAGRVTLAKTILQAISIYLMMSDMLPKRCIDQIHRT